MGIQLMCRQLQYVAVRPLISRRHANLSALADLHLPSLLQFTSSLFQICSTNAPGTPCKIRGNKIARMLKRSEDHPECEDVTVKCQTVPWSQTMSYTENKTANAHCRARNLTTESLSFWPHGNLLLDQWGSSYIGC